MYDAIVLAGGQSRRMAGQHKPSLVVAGVTLLDRVLTAVAGAARVLVVGPEQPTSHVVAFVTEDRPYGGPAAALAEVLPAVEGEVVVVVAADLPFLTAATVEALVAQAPAVLVDDDGREQWLCGAWRTEDLRRVCVGDLHGARLGELLAPLEPAHLPGGGVWHDVDTPDDLARARLR